MRDRKQLSTVSSAFHICLLCSGVCGSALSSGQRFVTMVSAADEFYDDLMSLVWFDIYFYADDITIVAVVDSPNCRSFVADLILQMLTGGVDNKMR